MVLAERNAELASLDDARRAAAGRSGSLVVVSGPVGFGKTTLLDAVAADAVQVGAAVLRATASTLEQPFPFAVTRQLCEPIIAELTEDERARLLDGVAEFVRPLFVADECAETTVDSLVPARQQVLHAVRHLLTVVGERRPVVLLVDDVQWSDEESLRCLGYLANRLGGTNVLMVVSIREGSPSGDGVLIRALVGCAGRVLRPGALSADGVRSVVLTRFGVPGTDRFLRACGDVSGGNPMILRAVLDELDAAGGRPEDGVVQWMLHCRPALLRERILARLRGQPEPTVMFLRALSCLGGFGEAKLIGRLAGLDGIGCTEAVRSLTSQGFLLPDRTPTFVHPVVKEAVDQLTSPIQNERLHVAAAALLHDAGHPIEQVAVHLLAVPTQQDIWAVDALRTAAEVAAQRGSADDAARYLRRALLDTAPGGANRADLLLELATVQRTVDASAAIRHVLEAVSLSDTAAAKAAALTRLSPVSLGMAPSALTAVIRETAAELGDVHRLTGAERDLALRLEARVLAGDQSGVPRVAAAVQRLRTLDQGEYLATTAGRELLAVLLEMAAVSGSVPSADVVRIGHRILELEPATASAHTALPMVISALVVADRAAPAGPWLDTALDHATRYRDRVAKVTAEVGRALLLIGAGRLDEGVAVAMAGADRMGERWFDAITVAGVLRIASGLKLHSYRVQGGGADHDLAVSIVNLCGHRTDHPAVVALLRLSAAARMAAGNELRSTLEHLLDCGRQLDRAGWRNPALVGWRGSAALMQYRLGNPSAALDLAEQEYELALAWGAPATLGRTLRMRGALTAGDGGLRLLHESVEVLQESENLLELGRAHLLLGGRLRQTGADAESAEEHLQCGRSLIEVGVTRRLVEQELRIFTGPAGRPEAGPGGQLTAAEHRVVVLAVDGHTNQGIADELGVSRRAVEKHLTNAYAKLQVTGRSELKSAVPADPRP